jgi:methylmalonyl-CoA/ethylmalonyl-CoA epimerase
VTEVIKNLDFVFDHVGIAVTSIAEAKKTYLALGFKGDVIEDVPAEKVRVCMFTLANDARVELIEPLNNESPIKKFLDNHGPGIHHYCLRVKDVKKSIKELKAQGLIIINDPPNEGAHNCLVSFIHPKSAGGVLIELSQKMGGSHP